MLAGLVGATHGYGEVLQGNGVPKDLLIDAYGGSGCSSGVHASCFPAMTVISGPFVISGILSIAVGLVILLATAMIVIGRWRGVPVLVLSLILLLVGGGFFPPIIGLVAALVGDRATERAALAPER